MFECLNDFFKSEGIGLLIQMLLSCLHLCNINFSLEQLIYILSIGLSMQGIGN